jgi:hypothetical protein
MAAFVFLNWRGSYAWDGYQIWATKALLLFQRGGLTQDVFLPGVYNRMVDYPPMVPLAEALVAWFRGAFNWDSIKPVFVLFLPSLLLSTWRAALPLAGPTRALWTTALVALIPHISMLSAAGGYADMPLAAMLMAVAAELLNLDGHAALPARHPLPWLLAGLLMVKNEGQILYTIAAAVILCALWLGGGLWSGLRRHRGAVLVALAGVGLRVLLLVWNHSTDAEFGFNLPRALTRLTAVPRAALHFLADPLQWGLLWPLFALALVVLLWMGPARERLLGAAVAAGIVAYTVIFYFTSWDLMDHMNSAYLRIVSQLAPLALLAVVTGLTRLAGAPGPTSQSAAGTEATPPSRPSRSKPSRPAYARRPPTPSP